jgi:hypothetical protein
MGLTAVSGMTIALEKVPALACPACGLPLRLQPEADPLRVLTDGWAGDCCSVGIRVEALSPAGTIRAQRQYWVDVLPDEPSV